MLGKTVNNGWGGYQCCWARTVLMTLIGGLEVPGGLLGTMVKLNRPADNRHKSVRPTNDGFMDYPFNETTKEGWCSKPDLRNAYRIFFQSGLSKKHALEEIGRTIQSSDEINRITAFISSSQRGICH